MKLKLILAAALAALSVSAQTARTNNLGAVLTAVAGLQELVPGFELRGDQLYWTPGATNTAAPLDPDYPPGTPVEGSKLTTETKELVPCFAAVIPACPGHWKTNLTEWVYRSGKWETAPSVVQTTTNVVSTNIVWVDGTSINWATAATNVFTTTPDARALRLEKEALEKQVEFWKTKALEGRP